MSDTDAAAIVLTWQWSNPQYFDSPFNGENFNRCLTKRLWHDHQRFSYALLDSVYTELSSGGYLEKQGPRKRGEFVGGSGPREYPVYATPQQTAAQELHRVEVAQAQEATDRDAAQNMSFSELQKAVRAGFNLSRAHEVMA